jgi:hypothetical protein
VTHTPNIKKGSLLPSFTCDLTSGGAVVDLTPATQPVHVILWRNNVLLRDASVTITAPTELSNGVVTMPWQAGDVDTVADLYVEVVVTWPGAKPQKFPDEGWMVVHVTRDLS